MLNDTRQFSSQVRRIAEERGPVMPASCRAFCPFGKRAVALSKHPLALLALGVALVIAGASGTAQAAGMDYSSVGYNQSNILQAICRLFLLIETSFGAMIATMAGIAAIVASAAGAYKAAWGLLAASVGAFTLRSLISLFFGMIGCLAQDGVIQVIVPDDSGYARQPEKTQVTPPSDPTGGSSSSNQQREQEYKDRVEKEKEASRRILLEAESCARIAAGAAALAYEVQKALDALQIRWQRALTPLEYNTIRSEAAEFMRRFCGDYPPGSFGAEEDPDLEGVSR